MAGVEHKRVLYGFHDFVTGKTDISRAAFLEAANNDNRDASIAGSMEEQAAFLEEQAETLLQRARRCRTVAGIFRAGEG